MGLRRRWEPRRDPLDAVWPSHLALFPDYAEVGDTYARSYTVVGYPREVSPGWFEPLMGFPDPITLAISCAPVDLGEAVKSIGRRMVWHRGSVAADRAQGRIGRAEDSVALEDAETVRRQMARGDARMLEVGLTITVWGGSLEELEHNSRLLESLAQGMMVVLRRLRFQQAIGLRRLWPLGEGSDKLREMDSRAWATLFPFSSRDVVHPHGQVMGINPASRTLVIVDRFQMAAPHSITIGWSGAGKSFAAKLEAVRSRYRGIRVTIVDPEGEYRWLAERGATLWTLGQASGFPYDPFTVDTGGIEERERQGDFILRLLRRLSPELMETWGISIHDALWHLMSGPPGRFTPDSVTAVTLDRLIEATDKADRRAGSRLRLAGERWRAAAGPPNAASDRFEVFDLSRLSESIKGAVYLALTEWVMRRMGRQEGRRLVIFDEAWRLLTDHSSAPYLEELFRRARKWGTALSLLSQDIGDFTRNRAAEVCFRNAPMVLLLRQHPESLAEVAELMRLHDGEVDWIGSAGTGEGLLILDDDHLPLKVIASRQEQQWLAPTGEGLG
ncbi:VirB4 family type IV secretion system protein [Sulfobacillus harzensis]|uniref:Conjugal transfer protein TraC n=1 Tax=Sulfobacillus harzensis TaxID=2729629 RepID=A0A7Y0L4K6_9FIRM|nr:conjugal transfer protein TraC [Sulfobacillus harzensis]NMP22571.1 conjugal transfer protein TraC [Sulfobacillus harzensis]